MNTQVAALNAAQQLIALMGAFESLSNQVDAFMKSYAQNNPDARWQAMATVSIGNDGSPAQTNDGTPNNANPINLPAGAPILVSRSALINAVTLLQKYQTFMSQAGGTMTLSAQANTATAYLVTG